MTDRRCVSSKGNIVQCNVHVCMNAWMCVIVDVCVWKVEVVKAPHQNAAAIQTLNCSTMNIKIARGEGSCPITVKNRKNSIMVVHACVKGFGGEVFLTCFSCSSRFKQPPLSLTETLTDKKIKSKGHILTNSLTHKVVLRERFFFLIPPFKSL